jgi:hypothetical protein
VISLVTVALFGLAASGVIGWAISGRNQQIRRQMRQQLRSGSGTRVPPQVRRMFLVSAHLWGLAVGLFALATLARGVQAQVAAEAAVAGVAVTMVLDIATPERVIPGWMREEVRAGTLVLPKPGNVDWLYLAVLPAPVLIGMAWLVALAVASGHWPDLSA